MKILCIIPARGGSKGVPHKNIKPLLGVPLIGYSIKAAFQSHCFDRVFVYTDDQEIVRVAKSFGAEVPLMEPSELAQDNSPIVEAIRYALTQLKEKENYVSDYVALIQPTSPLILPSDIKGAVSLLEKHPEADSLATVVEVVNYAPEKIKKFDGDYLISYSGENEGNIKSRHELVPAYRRNGALYISKREIWESGKTLGDKVLGYIMPLNRSVDIDTEYDFHLAEFILKNGYNK
jgi:N-acylneuraminate cytidylyltransferase/CMP-N,N'-diacetyllegionaminic acid synthase